MTATDLNGAVAIVTGASAGYGVGIARVLRQRGAQVFITARRADKLAAVAAALGAEAIVADVTSAADWDRVVATVTAAAGRIDVLVNNAGAGVKIAPLVELDEQDIRTCLEVNLTGAILGCQRVAPVMIQQGSGTMINVSSICDSQAWPGFTIYGAAKAGLLHFSKHLYVELRGHGVRVTCLTPSWGDTDFTAALGWAPQPDDVRAKMTQADELGEVVANVCELPAHLVIPTMTVLPLVQEIQPY